MAKIDDLEIIKKQAKLIKEFQTPITKVLKDLYPQDVLNPLSKGLLNANNGVLTTRNLGLGFQEGIVSKALKDACFQSNINKIGLNALLGDKMLSSGLQKSGIDFSYGVVSGILRDAAHQNSIKNLFRNENNALGFQKMSSSLTKGIISGILRDLPTQTLMEKIGGQIGKSLSFNFKNDAWIQSMLEDASRVTTQSYIDIIEYLKQVTPDDYFNDEKATSYDELTELVKNNYLNPDLTLNEENYNKASEAEKNDILVKVKKYWGIIGVILTFLGTIGFPIYPLLVERVPIFAQFDEFLFPNKIIVNGHIKSKLVDVYFYSSQTSHLVDKLEYGIPFEVKTFHSGWLKIKYIGIEEEIKEGWIREDNAIWSYNNE